MKKIFVFLFCLSLMLPSCAKRDIWLMSELGKDPHQVKYKAGSGVDGRYMTYVHFDSTKIYITPEYRKAKLALANTRANKSIAKLEKKLQKAKLKGKDLTKLTEQLNRERSSLVHALPWDNTGNISILFLPDPVRDDSAAPRMPARHSILDERRNLVCKPSTQKTMYLEESEQDYVKKVYGAKVRKLAPYALLVEYEAKCFLNGDAFQEKLEFDPAVGNRTFGHYYGLYEEIKELVWHEFNKKATSK